MSEVIGILAGFLTIISFLPQVVKIWIKKDVSSVSFLMYFLFCLGAFLWIIYGVLIDSPPVIIYNIISFILSLSTLILRKILKDNSSSFQP